MSWHRLMVGIGLAGLAVVVGALLIMVVNLVRFDAAEICDSTSSQGCILTSRATITSPSRKVHSYWCGSGPASSGCHDRDDYSIAVTPEGSTREVELWDTREHSDFRVGDSVTLELWHGQYIAVTDGSHRVEVNDWNPRLLAKIIISVAVSVPIIALLWRFKLANFDFDSPARGAKARLRSGLGFVVLLYGCLAILALFYVAVPASSPLLYLR
jgi:hypothetical protein